VKASWLSGTSRACQILLATSKEPDVVQRDTGREKKREGEGGIEIETRQREKRFGVFM
jgi:hypothetical protein